MMRLGKKFMVVAVLLVGLIFIVNLAYLFEPRREIEAEIEAEVLKIDQRIFSDRMSSYTRYYIYVELKDKKVVRVLWPLFLDKPEVGYIVPIIVNDDGKYSFNKSRWLVKQARVHSRHPINY